MNDEYDKQIKNIPPNLKKLICGKNYEFIDFIIRNEGDLSFLFLLKNINNPKVFEKIPGLSFRKGNKIINNPSKMIEDINKVPIPAFHLIKIEKEFEKLDKVSKEFGLEKQTLSLGLAASRGCPASCTFCTARLVLKPNWRIKTPEKVIEELKVVCTQFKSWKKRLDIDFVDNTFNASKEWVIKFCKLKKKNKNHYTIEITNKNDKAKKHKISSENLNLYCN